MVCSERDDEIDKRGNLGAKKSIKFPRHRHDDGT